MCRFVAVSQTVYNASPNQTHVDGIALAVGVATTTSRPARTVSAVSA